MPNTVLSAQHSKRVVPNVERFETPNGSPRRQAILDASARLFSDQGFSGTTIRQIAEHANIESGSLYHHFHSKNAILQEVLVFAISTTDRRTRATVTELPEGTSPRQKIEAALQAHLQVLHDHIEYTSTNSRYSGQIPTSVQTLVQPHRQNYSDFWQELLRQAQEDGAIKEDLNLSLLRPLILGTLNHTIDWYDAKRGNIDELFGIIKVMINGIWNVAD